jgi:alkylation response protein AidB-like acyl-CoA dehydrogenase
VRGLGTAAVTTRETAVVVAQSGDTQVVAWVGMTGLTLRPVSGIDPPLGLVEVTGEATPEGIGSGDWRAAVALGRLAIGHEIVGASRKMLDLARQHALERIQFGAPISTFQAVRHRLADTLVAIETADAMLDAAWLDRSPQNAAMAKALAGRGGRVAARHCQQVLAGIGFTTEHDFHRYFRRILVLDQLLGDSRSLTKELGVELLASRQLPPLLPLQAPSS